MKDMIDVLQSKERRASPFSIDGWNSLASPTNMTRETGFAQRDAFRRAKLTSLILLVFMIALIVLMPVGIFSHSPYAIAAISGGMLISFVALLFNRAGRLNIAGFLITLYVFTSVALVILSSPGGLSTTTLGLFYTLVFVEVLAASLLPVNWVLPIAVVNIAFVILDLLFQRKTPEFAAVLSTDFFPILTRILVLHVFVVIVLWLWVRSATQALERADRAEELALRERQIQELQQTGLRQKEELEKGIELILQTHIQVSNGDFEARAPLPQDSLLWRIAYSLNNLIGRMQNSLQAESELIYTRETVGRLTSELRQARKTQRPMRIVSTKTMLDPFLQELARLPRDSSPFQLQPTKDNENTKASHRAIPPRPQEK